MKNDPIGNAKDERTDWSTVILGQDSKAQKLKNILKLPEITQPLSEKQSNNIIQWAPLNGITLGQSKTDSNNRLMLISK